MGVGKGLARKFAISEHAIVCILDVNEKEGAKTASEINRDGGRAFFFKCNVSSADELRHCAKQIYAEPKLGRVDIVICNAAILRMGDFLEMTDDDFKNSMDINVLGYIYTIRTFLPAMAQKNKGHIVAVASVCSHYGDNLGTAYCTSKFAVRGLMETLEMEFAAKNWNGITLTTVYPYFIRTTLVTNNFSEIFSTFYDVLPLEKGVNDIADAILKERLTSFIPSSLAYFCTHVKAYVAKGKQCEDTAININASS